MSVSTLVVAAAVLLLVSPVLAALVCDASLVTVNTPPLPLFSTSVVEVLSATWVELSPVAGTQAASPSTNPSLRMSGT